MFIKNPELVINPHEPFNEDAFNRKEEIEKLTNILSFIEEPFVLAITSPWGNGKTKFLEMWRAFIQNKGINSIYYNAWENDFVVDPLISIIGEISSHIEKIQFNNKTKGKQALTRVKKISATVLKRSIPVATKLISAGIIDDKIIAEVISKTTNDIITEKIKEYEYSKKNINNFKKELETFVSSLSTDKEIQIPFLIFIDELDRCKPGFAIELLERLKHLFNVRGIVFVLAIDRKQLEKSVETIFGMDNPDGYIRKFIDLEYHLIEPDKGDFSNYLIHKLKIEDFVKHIREGNYQLEDLSDITSELFQLFDLKLRQQEQFFSQLVIILKLFPNAGDFHFSYLCLLLILSNYYREMFLEFSNGEMTGEQLLQFIESKEGSEKFFESYSACKIEVFLYHFFKDQSLVSKRIQKYNERKNSASEKSQRPSNIVYLYERLKIMQAEIILKLTVSRIIYSERYRR